jgi:hypothetical protein
MRKLTLLGLLLAIASSGAFGQAERPDPKSETEARNLETIRLWGEEVWGNGRLELVPDLVAPQYVRHNADGTRTVTPESYAREIEAARARNTTFTRNAMAIEGDFVWMRWSFRTESSDGREMEGRGLQIYRLENGKLAETWTLSVRDGAWSDN